MSNEKIIDISVAEVSLFEAHQKIYPRSVSGVFSRWRWAMVLLTQLVFYGLPWLSWGQRQAVLFDLAERRFYIFGLVLYPQDFIYLTALLVICALSLFLFTAVAGRLWCGFSCPQTVYTELFLWIERKIEGDRMARMRLDGAKFSLEKLMRKTLKHLIWIALALWTGITFVSYFTPLHDLELELLHHSISAWEVFWILFYGAATYGNAGFLREQVCKYMCPYARFQSAMFDKNTWIVSYDQQRGEPRGKEQSGSCIDCTLCVQVCPTGIDIRKGLQYECIGCGACIDVCNTVMDRVGQPRGLIRLSTQQAMQEPPSARSQRALDVLRKILRPRVIVYTVLLWVLIVGTVLSLAMRKPLKVDVVRDRATLSRIVAGGKLENVYRLQIMNATEERQSYQITAHGLEGLEVIPSASFAIDAAAARWLTVSLRIPYGSASPGSHTVFFDVHNQTVTVSEKSVFLVPR